VENKREEQIKEVDREEIYAIYAQGITDGIHRERETVMNGFILCLNLPFFKLSDFLKFYCSQNILISGRDP
jgi:hypothetical protein